MSFDIYGNNLKRGHCEVHPNVAEEYPCSLCQSHSQSYSQESNAAYEAQSLRNDLANSNSYIESLKADLAKVTAERDLAIKELYVLENWQRDVYSLSAWLVFHASNTDATMENARVLLAKRDLEQQAKGIEDAIKHSCYKKLYFVDGVSHIEKICLEEDLSLFSENLRKQAEEL